MASAESIVNHVLRTKSITDYLELKGITPEKNLSCGRKAYLCPMPDHNETKPSFVVFPGSDYETYYCFGCQSGITVINLVAGMNSISYRQALKDLSDGYEISLEDEQRLAVEKTLHSCVKNMDSWDFSESLMQISMYCRSYLEGVNKDSLECEIIDRFYEAVDKDIASCNFDEINETVKFLVPNIRKRRDKYEKKKREQLIKKYAGS